MTTSRRDKDDSESEEGGGKHPKQQNTAPQLIEWVLAGLSFILVLGVVGFLLVEAITASASKPDLSVSAEAVEALSVGYLVPFTVRNTGETTAASVIVEATLSAPGQPEQRSEVTLDYVPALSENHGGFFFEQDPRSFDLRVRVLGYQEP